MIGSSQRNRFWDGLGNVAYAESINVKSGMVYLYNPFLGRKKMAMVYGFATSPRNRFPRLKAKCIKPNNKPIPNITMRKRNSQMVLVYGIEWTPNYNFTIPKSGCLKSPHSNESKGLNPYVLMVSKVVSTLRAAGGRCSDWSCPPRGPCPATAPGWASNTRAEAPCQPHREISPEKWEFIV